MINKIFVFIISSMVVTFVLFITFFLYDPTNNKYIYLILSCISLFIVGILTLIIVLKEDDNDIYKYVILDKEEYEIMKNTLYDQRREIKKLKTIIRNK